MQYKIRHLCFLLLITGFLGCSKGMPINEQLYVDVNFGVNTIDPLLFQLYVNGERNNNIVTNGSALGMKVYLDPLTQSASMHIEEWAERTVIMDTAYFPQLGSRQIHSFVIYQPRSGDTPFFVHPPPDEPRPVGNVSKLQVTTRGVGMPASLKLVFYQAQDTVPMDSLIVEPYKFSGFAVLKRDIKLSLEYIAYNNTTGAVYHTRRKFPFGTTNQSPGGIDIVLIAEPGTNFTYSRLF